MYLHQFSISYQLPEHDTGLVTALHPLDGKDPLDDGSLADVADVDGGPEAPHDLGRVEEDTDRGLEVLTGDWLVTLGTDGHHPSPQLGAGDVQGEGGALLGPHQAAGCLVPSDTGNLRQSVSTSLQSYS